MRRCTAPSPQAGTRPPRAECPARAPRPGGPRRRPTAVTTLFLSRLFGWFKRKPGSVLVARWRVEPELWRQFLAMEASRGTGEPLSELPRTGEPPPEGIEILFEPHAIWFGGKRVSVPLRGTPEVLRAEIQETAHWPTTVELSLKYPPYWTRSGGMRPPTYTRLAVPVPRSAWRDAKTMVAHFNRDAPGKPDFFHGPGDGSDPEDLSRCWSCGHETHKLRSECERCGASLQSRRWARRFGGVLVFCGLVIGGLMGAVLYNMAPLLLQPGVSINGSRFSGSGPLAAVVLAIFIAVFAFGATALAYGVWQVATGKRNRRVAYYMISLFSIITTAATLMTWLGP